NSLKVSLEKMRLDAGESTQLTAEGTENKVGRFNCKVLLKTSDAKVGTIAVPIHGYVEQPVGFDPPVVRMEHVPVDHSTGVTVLLDLSKGVDFRKLTLKLPSGVPLSGRLTQDQTGQPILRLTWDGDRTLGWRRYSVEVRAGNPAQFVSSPLPVAVEVVPLADVYPSSLKMSPSDGPNWSRRVLVKLNQHDDHQPVLSWSDPTVANTIEAKLERTSADQFFVVLRKKSQDSFALPKKTDLSISCSGRVVGTITIFVIDSMHGTPADRAKR